MTDDGPTSISQNLSGTADPVPCPLCGGLSTTGHACSTVPAANDGGRAPPAILLPSEELDAAKHAPPHRPMRERLHGADCPLGFFANRGASRRVHS